MVISDKEENKLEKENKGVRQGRLHCKSCRYWGERAFLAENSRCEGPEAESCCLGAARRPKLSPWRQIMWGLMAFTLE